jgi:hypothetical protein
MWLRPSLFTPQAQLIHFARYSVVASFIAGNTSDLREILLIMAAHMLVGLFAKYGVVSFQTLKTIYQRYK